MQRIEAWLDRNRRWVEPMLPALGFIGYGLMAWGLARMLGVL